MLYESVRRTNVLSKKDEELAIEESRPQDQPLQKIVYMNKN